MALIVTVDVASEPLLLAGEIKVSPRMREVIRDNRAGRPGKLIEWERAV